MKVCSLKPLMFVDEMVCTSICLNVRIELFSLGILTWNATHASDSVAWNSFFLCVGGGWGFLEERKFVRRSVLYHILILEYRIEGFPLYTCACLEYFEVRADKEVYSYK